MKAGEKAFVGSFICSIRRHIEWLFITAMPTRIIFSLQSQSVSSSFDSHHSRAFFDGHR